MVFTDLYSLHTNSVLYILLHFKISSLFGKLSEDRCRGNNSHEINLATSFKLTFFQNFMQDFDTAQWYDEIYLS